MQKSKQDFDYTTGEKFFKPRTNSVSSFNKKKRPRSQKGLSK